MLYRGYWPQRYTFFLLSAVTHRELYRGYYIKNISKNADAYQMGYSNPCKASSICGDAHCDNAEFHISGFE